MKTLTINRLSLKNFKGIKNFTIEPNGQNISVFGENGTGKSTIADGFFYLLFGKDSHDKANFQLKPVTDDGQEIHNIETEVEAALEVNGKTITLKKIYKEKWTKKRGTNVKEHTGHTKKHYIDDVPKSEADFKKAVAEIIDINAFKLVTNPFEFNNLHYTGRRQILLEVCGDVSYQDVISSDKKLAALSAVLGDCTIDDHKAKVKEAQRKINQDLKEIPARIDELQNSIKDSEKPNQKDKERLDKELAGHQEKLRALQTNERLSELNVKLNEIDAKIAKLNAVADKKQAAARKPILDSIEKLESERRQAESRVNELEKQVKTYAKRNQIAKDAKNAKLQDWHNENNKQLKPDNTCPTCGQDLPEDQVQDAIEKFNVAKSNRLEKIEKEGMSLKKDIEQRTKDITGAQEEVDKLSTRIVDIDSTLAKKRADLKAVYEKVEAADLDKEKDVIESEIKALQNGSKIQEDTQKRYITETQEKLAEWNKADAAWESAEKARVRIDELTRQEETLAAEYERLAGEVHMIEQFIVKKVEMLEGRINERFKMARFKMFEEQVNGGINECCEVLYQGVPFNSGLNSAARVNVGLDIINTLSEFYGFRGPVWVDNAESINKVLPIDTQVICLSVSTDKELTVSETEALKAS